MLWLNKLRGERISSKRKGDNMVLYQLVVPLGKKSRDEVQAIIMKYTEDSSREINNLSHGILSEERTLILYKNVKAYAERVVVFEGHSDGDLAAVLHKQHLSALAQQLNQHGFDCHEGSVWIGRLKEEDNKFI